MPLWLIALLAYLLAPFAVIIAMMLAGEIVLLVSELATRARGGLASRHER